MTSSEIRKRFLQFFESRGHTIIPSASLVPENDPTVLFNTAGMQPLVPYLLGQPHPAGKRIANVQKCVRTGDLDDIGDNRHFSFFEMMGNWSLGDYFKEDAIKWSYEFLTNKEIGLGLDANRLYVTCFEGDENAPRDEKTFEIWKSLGIPESRIYFLGASENWWSPGDNGPCGPDSEMFYDLTEESKGDLSKENFISAVQKEDLVEIWNDVFMEYLSKDGKVISKLETQNVDTGAGLERMTAVMQGKKTAYETDIFAKIVGKIDELTVTPDDKARRIVADHIRTAVMLIADGVIPANSDQGYVLRRLLRRAVRHADKLGIESNSLARIAEAVIETYKDTYPNVLEQSEKIKNEIDVEEQKFRKTLSQGLKEFEKQDATVYVGSHTIQGINGKRAFDLFTTYGFPIELTIELAKEKNMEVDIAEFDRLMNEHRQKSRAGAEQKFKGGLGDTSEMSLRYHTATHLLHQALRTVLGDHVSQKGSNITPERLRFDFTHPAKMTDEEKQKVEEIVNEQIKAELPVQVISLPKDEAEKTGALHFFGDKYGEMVTVYYIGNDLEHAYSKEFCGGPHVKNTSELGNFKIAKEEAVSAGVRRIKAVLS